MSERMTLEFDTQDQLFVQLDWADDSALVTAVQRCIEAQRAAAAGALRRYRPHPEAARHVSPEALDQILRSGVRINGIATEPEISNCIAFNFGKVQGAVLNQDVVELRRRVDQIVAAKLRALFRNGRPLQITNSGHFWYPPGGYMSWHTNLRTPGWRLYINYVDEPGKSFFRYRHPDTGEITTATDRTWNFRLFKITPQRPLWHAIYSETNRFSIGYKVTPRPSFVRRAARRLSTWVTSSGRPGVS